MIGQDQVRVGGEATIDVAGDRRPREDAAATAVPGRATAVALGFAVALLVYSTLQIAEAAGHPLMRVGTDAIPLFARWRAGALVGSFATLFATASGARRWVARLAAWTTIAACAALVVVIVVAP
jgi:hypothetical protein